MKLFNTYGRTLEDFHPIDQGLVKMYVCGPTVQDLVHLGHGRTFVAFDGISRYFKLRGYSVFRVQNITDIDDKIINKAKERGIDWREVSEYYSREYLDALSSLKVHVDAHPKVTSHIGEIISFIQGLIDKGHAYATPSGSVYFEVDTFPNYGALSNSRRESWEQEKEFLSEKRKPYDFALWKASKPGEPYWESPWGKGRPGWHIECSTMSSRYLGERFDIHGGGGDLIFPHHENEIAQSEAYFGHRWVNYWMHVSFLTIKKEKMSKSVGNIIPLKDAIKSYGPTVLRYWFLSTNYRTPVDFSEEALENARVSLRRLKDAVATLKGVIKQGPKFRSDDESIKDQGRILSLMGDFHSRMSYDFDFSGAMASVHEVASLVFERVQHSEDYTSALLALELFRQFNQVYRVMDEDLGEGGTDVSRIIDGVLEVRTQLRSKGMYELSDYIRTVLESSGVKVLDSKGKSTWRFE